MKTIDTINFAQKRALIRVDFNVPLNSDFEITDASRINAAIPTIQKILKDKTKKMKGIQSSSKVHQAENTSSDDENVKKINIVIKSDVLGSAEAIEESLEKINTEEIKVKIIYKGLGNITDGDIKRAEAVNGFVISFNVKTPPVIEELAREKNVEIKSYNIIYDLINDIKELMRSLIKPTIKRTDLGKLKVLAIFRTDKDGQIIGGKVLNDKIESNTNFEIFRNKENIGEGKLVKLQAGKQDVNEVQANEECGIQFEGRPIVEEGDVLHFYKNEEIYSKL